MAKRGPKLTPIDWEQFDKLCALQVTLTELASWFECSVDTIERAVVREKGVKFAEYFDQKRQLGKIALRRKMFQVAVDQGSPALLIWLSKQYLGHTEKIETTNKNTNEDKLFIATFGAPTSATGT